MNRLPLASRAFRMAYSTYQKKYLAHVYPELTPDDIGFITTYLVVMRKRIAQEVEIPFP